MRRRTLLALFVVALAAAGARADTVYLRNGSVIEGTAIDTGAEWQVHLRLGVVSLEKGQVLRVERRKSVAIQYLERSLRLDTTRPVEVLRFARWCEANGLDRAAGELREVARGEVLEQKVAAAEQGSARTFLDLALWASAEGYGERVYRYLVEKAIEVDPNYRPARYMIGQALYQGEWLDRAEIARRKEAAFARSMEERGYLLYEGAWRPAADVKAALVERDDLRRRAARLEAILVLVRGPSPAPATAPATDSEDMGEPETPPLAERDLALELESLRCRIDDLERALARERAAEEAGRRAPATSSPAPPP